MINALAEIQKELAPQKTEENALINKGMLGGKYLPQLRISSSGKLVEQGIKAGNYCLVQGDGVEDLGDQVDFVPLAHRCKAVDYEEGVSSYDADSTVFVDIQERSEVKDSGCVYGLEFLCYLPSCSRFVTFFCNSASLRRASSGVLSREFKGVHGESKMVDGKKRGQRWAVPLWSDLDPEIQLNLPESSDIKEQMVKFAKEAATSEQELADDGSTRDV